MAQETKHAKARKTFEQLAIGERISAAELSNRVGATESRDRTSVSAFLSQLAKRGRAKKHMGEDGRMYYEKMAPTAKPLTPRAAPPKDRKKDEVTLGEIGESIVNYIEKLKRRIDGLEKERDRLKEKGRAFPAKRRSSSGSMRKRSKRSRDYPKSNR